MKEGAKSDVRVSGGITRRGLLKWTGLTAIGTAALGTTGCAGFDQTDLAETGEGTEEDPGT